MHVVLQGNKMLLIIAQPKPSPILSFCLGDRVCTNMQLLQSTSRGKIWVQELEGIFF